MTRSRSTRRSSTSSWATRPPKRHRLARHQAVVVMLANPEFGCDLAPIDFAAVARACGGSGFTIEDPERCGDVLDQALSTPGPVVVQAVVEPYEPPLPPHATLEQAYGFGKSLLRGESDGAKIIATLFEDKIKEMI